MTRQTLAETQLPPVAVPALIKAIKAHLDLSYDAMALYSGRAYNTLEGWALGTPAYQIEALLRLLARLPVAQRHRLIDAACPSFPSLAHPFLARDRLLTARLEGLLRQPSGATFVLGSSDYLTTFVITALGHSRACTQKDPATAIGGLDAHNLDGLIPVPGVTYLGADPPAHALDVQKQRHEGRWKQADLLLFNRVCSRSAGLRSFAEAASARAHVLVAEASLAPREMARFSGPRTVITVDLDRRFVNREDDAAHLLLQVQTESR